MRKIKIPAAIILAVALIFALAACAARPAVSPDAETSGDVQTGEGYDVVFIPDAGELEDGVYNQVIYRTAEAKALQGGLTFGYCLHEDGTAQSLEKAVDDAAGMGARYVVTAGQSFAEIIMTVQDKYPEIMFLCVDATVSDPAALNGNVTCISFKECQSGFAAGYAIVMDGCKKLAFVGGREVASVVNYGYGFIQGAEYAASELASRDVEIDYWYSGTFTADESVKEKAVELYKNGDEVIFSCGGAIIANCIAAADECDGKLIGVDSDQSALSEHIVTSAYKNLAAVTNASLQALFDNGGKWPSEYSGQQVMVDATSNCVGLPTTKDAWRFDSFTMTDYQTIMLKVVEGRVTITDAAAGKPETEYIKVNYMN